MAVVWPSKNNFANGDVLTAANMNNIADTLNVFNPSSATNGQAWIANGSGSGAYGSVGAPVSIAAATATSVASVTISSIPGTYRALQFNINATPVTTAQPLLRINGATDSNYRWTHLQSATTTGGNNLSATSIALSSTSTSGTNFGGSVVWNGYDTNGMRTLCWFNTAWVGSPSAAAIGSGCHLGNNVTSITFLFDTGNISTITYELLGFM